MMNLIKNQDHQALGNQITSWIYKPAKARKTIFTILGVMGGLLIAVLIYGSQFFPWFKKISTYFIYFAIFALSPIVKYLTGLGKDYYYELYHNGLIIRRKGNKGFENVRQALWEEFDSCQKKAQVIKLIPRSPIERRVKLYATSNHMEIFSICSERINSAKYLEMSKRKTLSDWQRQSTGSPFGKNPKQSRLFGI